MTYSFTTPPEPGARNSYTYSPFNSSALGVTAATKDTVSARQGDSVTRALGSGNIELIRNEIRAIDAAILGLTKTNGLLKSKATIVGGVWTPFSLKQQYDANNALIAQKRVDRAALSTKLTELLASSAPLEPPQGPGAPGPGGGGGGGGGKPNIDNSPRVNLSACKELYFRGEQRFLMETLDVPSNVPGGSNLEASFATAELLWKQGKATKGRIQTFIPPKSNKSVGSFGGRQLEDFAAAKSLGRRGFQFHYNPGSVDMSYGSVNDVDLGYLASGQAVTNFLQALGQISFEILLNRMPDMKYIAAPGQPYSLPNGKYQFSTDYTKVGVNYARDVYDRAPQLTPSSSNELKDIYNKGTMYDLEFLLRVLMGGVSFKSQLRGGEITSDLGFAIPQPVELHLGNRLRYVISVTNLNVRHVIFNERMVPLFSTVSITANRVPSDTVSVTNLDLSGSQSTTTTQ